MEFGRYETDDFGDNCATYHLYDVTDRRKHKLHRYTDNHFILDRIRVDPTTCFSLHEKVLVVRCGAPTMKDGIEHFEGEGHTIDISADKIIIDAGVN